MGLKHIRKHEILGKLEMTIQTSIILETTCSLEGWVALT